MNFCRDLLTSSVNELVKTSAGATATIYSDLALE